MKGKLVSCVVVLACLILQAMPVMAATDTTEVTGTVPLVTYDVSATNITHTSATISWNTNGDATSQVFYDTAAHADIADYAYSTTEDTNLVTVHSVPLTGLSWETTYHYRVKSTMNGDESVSDDYTFTTTTSSACFIATAAYGTPTAEQINILREFRDEVLLPSKAGAAFVAFYYRNSPPIADFIAQHEFLRTMVREVFINPLVAIVRYSHRLWDK